MKKQQAFPKNTFIPFFVHVDTLYGGFFFELNEKERSDIAEKKKDLNAILEERVLEFLSINNKNGNKGK